MKLPDMAEAAAGRLTIRHLILDGRDRHPAGANGVYQVARRLALEQIHAGDDAAIVVLRHPERHDSTTVGDVPSIGVPLIGTEIRRRTVRLRGDVASALLAALGPSCIVHIHGGRDPLLPWLSRVFRRSGIPYVITIHGRYSHVFLSGGGLGRHAVRLYLRAFERRLLEGARFVHAVSAEERETLHRLAPRATIHVVPNAAFSSAIEGIPSFEPRPAGHEGFPIFGYCGRYEIGHKGLDLLLGGFALHCAAGRPGSLRMIGSGPGRRMLIEMAASLGIADRVRIDGPQFGDEKAGAQRHWDFFVQSSRFEGMPIGALEAALAGLPLVATDATGLGVAVSTYGAGFRVRHPMVETVAEALGAAAALPPPAWSAMSEKAYSMALAIGDWTTTSNRLRDLYRRRT